MKMKQWVVTLIKIGLIVAGGAVLLLFTAPLWLYLYECLRHLLRRGSDAPVNLWMLAPIVLLGSILLFTFVMPILGYVLGKIYLYLSLAFTCLVCGYRVRLTRLPFVSLGGVKTRADIVITAKSGTLHLHMLDIVFPFRRSFAANQSGEYSLSPFIPYRVKRLQGQSGYMMIKSGRAPIINPAKIFVTTEGMATDGRGKTKKLPEIAPRSGEKHILLLPFLPAHATYTDGRTTVSLGSGLKIGDMIFYTAKQLRRGLRNKLHVSIFDYEKGE